MHGRHRVGSCNLYTRVRCHALSVPTAYAHLKAVRLPGTWLTRYASARSESPCKYSIVVWSAIILGQYDHSRFSNRTGLNSAKSSLSARAARPDRAAVRWWHRNWKTTLNTDVHAASTIRCDGQWVCGGGPWNSFIPELLYAASPTPNPNEQFLPAAHAARICRLIRAKTPSLNTDMRHK